MQSLNSILQRTHIEMERPQKEEFIREFKDAKVGPSREVVLAKYGISMEEPNDAIRKLYVLAVCKKREAEPLLKLIDHPAQIKHIMKDLEPVDFIERAKVLLHHKCYHELVVMACKRATNQSSEEDWNRIFRCIGLNCKYDDRMKGGMSFLYQYMQFKQLISFGESKKVVLSHFESHQVKEKLDVLSNFPLEELDSLRFWGCFKKGDLHHPLVSSFDRMQGLSSLHFEFTPLGDELIENLASIMVSLKNCKTLEIHDGRLNERNITPLCDSIGKMGSLEHLRLSGNGFSQQQLVSIREVLKKMPQCTVLDLSRNDINVDGIKVLAGGLKQLPNLRSLVLSYNSLRDEGAVALAGTLGDSDVLKILDLESNRIKIKGAYALTETFRPDYVRLPPYLEIPEESSLGKVCR